MSARGLSEQNPRTGFVVFQILGWNPKKGIFDFWSSNFLNIWHFRQKGTAGSNANDKREND
jgi:hypothetical protein